MNMNEICCQPGTTDDQVNITKGHSNAFVILNGIPYLVAEYVDNRAYGQVEREQVRSELLVDTSDCNRVIIDLSIDDIGKDSEGNLNALGNVEAKKNLIQAIKNNKSNLQYKFPVLRKGIIVRVNYQLENQKTGLILRSMVEDLRVFDRGYYLDIDSDNLTDTTVVVNFSNSLVSTVTQFTHGLEPMVLRITKVQLLYETVLPHPFVPRYTDGTVSDPTMSRYFFGCDADIYNLHDQFQRKHRLSSYSGKTVDEYIPNTWDAFSRFYHFDNEHRDIVINDQEVYDSHTKVLPICCGEVKLNRAFVVNPGARLVFKISIWKNDLVVTNDCSDIADALGCPLKQPTTKPSTDDGCGCCQPEEDDKLEELERKVDQLLQAVNSKEKICKPAKPKPEQNTAPEDTESIPATDPTLAKLIEKIDAMDRHLKHIEKRLDNTVEREYLDTVLTEVNSAVTDENPPKYCTINIPDDMDLSLVEKPRVGHIRVDYRNKNMVFVKNTDEGSPSTTLSGWWAKVRINAPEDMKKQDCCSKVQMRFRRVGAHKWQPIDFWKCQDSDCNTEDCQRYMILYCHVTPAKLLDAVNHNRPLSYELQMDWNGNSAYENVVTIDINPARVTLYDQSGNMLWPMVR